MRAREHKYVEAGSRVYKQGGSPKQQELRIWHPLQRLRPEEADTTKKGCLKVPVETSRSTKPLPDEET